jgi:hypothetical protein
MLREPSSWDRLATLGAVISTFLGDRPTFILDRSSPLLEIALVLVRLDYVASRIVNTNRNIM